MPKETERLKLPLPLGNENVTRESINGIFEKIDAGVATQADLDTLREAVSMMNIPDASLTQKGKVQLSNKTNGASETVAATEKAVRDARVEAINAAATDATTKANAAVAPIISLDSSNLVQNSSANLGLYRWSDYGSAPWSVNAGTNFRTLKYFQVTGAVAANDYAVLDSNATNVIAGIYNLQAMFYTLGMTTGVMLIEVKNANDDVTINSLVADSNSNWHRKTKTVTIPSGVTSVKLRLVVAGGTTGVPGSVKAISRIKFSAGALDVPYTAEADDLALFQSGVDAKNGIVGAINAKGGSASTNDNWAQLAAKINAIEQAKYNRGAVTTFNTQVNATSAGINVMGVLKSYEAGTKTIFLTPYPAGTAYLGIWSTSGNISGYLALRDSAGRIWQISKASNAGSVNFSNVFIDVNTGGMNATWDGGGGGFITAYNPNFPWSLQSGVPKPSVFDSEGPLDLVLVGQVLTSSPGGLYLSVRIERFESISG